MSSAEEKRSADDQVDRGAWYNDIWFIWLFAFTFCIPLLWPSTPPLSDLPGHMSRYYIELNLHNSASLQRWYSLQTVIVGNLGVDALMIPFGKLLGVELGTKIVVMMIPPLTVVGFLLTARAVHLRVPPTAYLATPLAYSYPFQFGFVNFALSVALAFLGFAFWVRMARARWGKYRGAAFAVISVIIWLAHIYGWGVLCVLVFSYEATRAWREKARLTDRLRTVIVSCLPLALPILIMMATKPAGSSGGVEDWFNMFAKLIFFVSPLRDHWMAWDLGAALILFSFVCVFVLTERASVSGELALATLLFLLLFLLIPRMLMGSMLADMRMVPIIYATAILMCGSPPSLTARKASLVASTALGFAILRLIGTTWSYVIYDKVLSSELEAVAFIPQGARMIGLVGNASETGWSLPRTGHLPSFALMQKEAFSNDQYIIPDGGPLALLHAPVKGLDRDPSQNVQNPVTMRHKLSLITPDAINTLWIINNPDGPPSAPADMHAVWRHNNSAVFLNGK